MVSDSVTTTWSQVHTLLVNYFRNSAPQDTQAIYQFNSTDKKEEISDFKTGKVKRQGRENLRKEKDQKGPHVGSTEGQIKMQWEDQVNKQGLMDHLVMESESELPARVPDVRGEHDCDGGELPARVPDVRGNGGGNLQVLAFEEQMVEESYLREFRMFLEKMLEESYLHEVQMFLEKVITVESDLDELDSGHSGRRCVWQESCMHHFRMFTERIEESYLHEFRNLVENIVESLHEF